MTSTPPAEIASTIASASSDDGARKTGMIPIRRIRVRTSCFNTKIPPFARDSPLDPRTRTGHQFSHILKRGERIIAWSRHGKRAMGNAAVERPI
jgi:hypothetical protein